MNKIIFKENKSFIQYLNIYIIKNGYKSKGISIYVNQNNLDNLGIQFGVITNEYLFFIYFILENK